MEQKVRRRFVAMDSEIICECKTIRDPVDSSMDLHNHDGDEILMVLDGIIDFYVEGGGARLERGDLICIREFDFHRGALQTKEQYNRVVINVKGGLLKQLASYGIDFDVCFQKLPDNPLNRIHLSESEVEQVENYAKILQGSLVKKPLGNEMETEALLRLIMVVATRHFINKKAPRNTEIMPELVVKTFDYIEKHISEEISLKRLEENVYHNGTYISRCFKRVTGITLQQFIIAKKITLSCKLLNEGHSPCDVCYMTGFNNYSNYSRTFAKQIGMSPKQYQMKNR